jgi:hypothetical protein
VASEFEIVAPRHDGHNAQTHVRQYRSLDLRPQVSENYRRIGNRFIEKDNFGDTIDRKLRQASLMDGCKYLVGTRVYAFLSHAYHHDDKENR